MFKSVYFVFPLHEVAFILSSKDFDVNKILQIFSIITKKHTIKYRREISIC